MGRVAVVGAGIVGARTVRELVSPDHAWQPTNDGVVLISRRAARLEQLAPVFGTSVSTVHSEQLPALPEDVSVVVVTREAGAHLPVVEAAVRQGRHVVSVSDAPDEVEALLALGGAARDAGVSVLVGVAMSPGLSCVLARHAARHLDRVDEIHVARDGVAGPACARQRLRALRGGAVDWRDGAYVRRPGFSGRELCWFPDPVGPRDCFRAELAEPYVLVPAFPGVQRVTARMAASRRDRALAPLPVLLPPPTEGGPGAVRVEVRGVSGVERATVVYGVFDRAGVVASVLSAVAATSLSASLPHGAYGLAAVDSSGPLLAELARRGVRVARFDGGL
ncbi:MAG: saccharopine dehydrogenase family protein [Actinomycetes bacterium]